MDAMLTKLEHMFETTTKSWLKLRVAGVLLGLLTPWFVWFACEALGVLNGAGATRQQFIETISQPWHAICFVLFSMAMFMHSRFGLNEIVEDYIQPKIIKVPLLLWILIYYGFLLLAVFGAVGYIVFGAGV